MTQEEREKLIKDMAEAIKEDEWIDEFEQARAALAIAEAAFAKEIEAAYKEGYKTGLRGRETDRSNSKDRCWRESRAYAAILSSIPEQSND